MNRIPPQATEVEQKILGSMLLIKDAQTIAFETLLKDDFYDNRNTEIFSSMLSLYMENKPIDLLTVEQSLRDKDKLDKVTSPYLSSLTSTYIEEDNVAYYAQIVREKSLKRKLIAECEKVITGAYNQDTSVYELADTIGRAILDLEKSGSKTLDVADVMQNVIKSISKIQDSGEVEAYKTGLRLLDNLIVGFQKAKFYIIAGRPSMGKTAFALTLMRRFAKNNVGVGILSLETSSDSIGFRLISSVSGISVTHLQRPNLSKEQLTRVMDAGAKLSELKIAIDDTASLTDIQLKSKCRSLVQKHDCKIIFVDYLQLLSGEGQTREREIAGISRICKIISKEMDIAVVALAQLSRAVEQRGGDKRPMLSDLRDTGQIEQDADVVMFLYRPEYYGVSIDSETGQSTDGELQVIVAKQKDGATGIATLHFDKERMSVENREKNY